jgi:Ca-activated chloride channel homolog
VSVASPWLLAIVAVAAPLIVLTVRRASSLSPGRRALFIGLRAAALALLAIALAGPAVGRLTDRLSFVFLLDSSHSIAASERERALALVERVRSRLAPGDSAFLVRFGADAAIESLAPGRAVDAEADTAVDGSGTDIASALRLGLAEAGRAGAGAPRLVLLSDGNQTAGSAEAAAAEAGALGARIFAVPLEPAAAPGEVAVTEVAAPARVRAGEPHQVTVLVRSLGPARARVTLLRDGEPAGTREQALTPGENAVVFTGLFPERGLHAWEAVCQAPADAVPENNRFRRLVEVTGNPQVLYAARPGRGSPALLAALAAQAIAVVEVDPSALPGSLAGFLPYDAVILDNVPGFGLSYEKMETIERYVRDAGGGLLMIGGENSFGAGGYYKTPIERALPVDMDVKSQVQVPRLSLVIVADKSGSMGAAVASGEMKIDVVKSAAFSAVELLGPFDRVGLLAFDADVEWTVPLKEAADRELIAAELASLSPGGGTIMLPALAEAYRVLSLQPSPLRHIIVLSDGLTSPGEFESLVGRIARDKITVSTVAVGGDADTGLLRTIAARGGGRYYAASDPRSVPRIFMTETILVSRELLVEKRFLPSVWSGSEIVSGIAPAGIPPLDGFVLTYVKTGAEKVLTALYDAPLLAAWHYGLGRSAAFTADMGRRWAGSWPAWDAFPRFAAQLVRWIERPAPADTLHPRVTLADGRGTIQVDAFDEVGAWVNGLSLAASVSGPALRGEEVRLAQTGPGLYEGAFRAEAVGDYAVTLSAESPGGLLLRTAAASRPYSEEYRILAPDTRLLGRLASATGGRLVSPASDEAALAALLAREPGPAAAPGSRGILSPPGRAWPWLLAAALLLFVLDVAARTLVVPDALRARLAPIARLLGRGAGGPGAGRTYEEIASMVARARAEERKKLGERITTAAARGKLDPDLAAYLYIARLRSSREQARPPRPAEPRDTVP